MALSLVSVENWARRLLVVEDDSLVATLLKDLLNKSGFEVRTAANAADALELVEEFDPDGALLDINLGTGPTGLALGHLLNREHPGVGLIFLTRYPDPHGLGYDKWDLPPGSSFLSKSEVTDADYLKQVIEKALVGEANIIHGGSVAGPLSRLTRVQIEILNLVARGFTNAAIAAHRSTKERTVEQRLQSIYAALEITDSSEVNSRVEAVRIYIAEAGMPSNAP